MTKTTASVAGGALPKIDRQDVMIRAWQTYRSAWSDIPDAIRRRGRAKTFGVCLSLAWEGVKRETTFAAADPIAQRIIILRDGIERTSMSENWRQARCDINAAHTEIARLSAA